MLAADGAEKRYLYPNCMSDEMAKMVPPVIVYTTEFDLYRRGAEEAAELYERNGKLIALGVLRGTNHGSYMVYSQKRSDEWFTVMANACKLYL